PAVPHRPARQGQPGRQRDTARRAGLRKPSTTMRAGPKGASTQRPGPHPTTRDEDPVMDSDTAQDLRDWARGIYTIEAAVDLLVRFQGGRCARPGEPGIVAPREQRRGNMQSRHWLDVNQLTAEATADAALSGGERRILTVAASLAGGSPIDLADAVSGLDREN